jgi:hypothetical protein
VKGGFLTRIRCKHVRSLARRVALYLIAVRPLQIFMTLALSFLPGRHGVIEDGIDGGVDVEH